MQIRLPLQHRFFIQSLVLFFFFLSSPPACQCLQESPLLLSRREWLATTTTTTAAGSSFLLSSSATAPAASSSSLPLLDETTTSATTVPTFQTAAYTRREYTNSITASRDTNVSPAEAYDMIRQHIPLAGSSSNNNKNNNNANGNDNNNNDKDDIIRALDLGAGAGVSTAVLWQMGYKTHIDAVDWSKAAWDQNVQLPIPDSIHFWEMSDQDFFELVLLSNNNKSGNNNPIHDIPKYDAIVYNFAVNFEKAVAVAQSYLKPHTGRLLAPCNDQHDYWYKQSYVVLNQLGQVMYKSGAEVGAWYVQFQPDVTSPTCTGIWCGNQNGFVPKTSSKNK